MEISEEDQRCRDLDWFAVDDEGCVGHFTSAGFKLLPTTVVRSAEDLEIILEFFERSTPIRESHFVDEQIIDSLRKEKNPERRLRDFVAMADRGLYSYDIESYGDTYFRVAIPTSPIRIYELPENIQSILKQTHARNILFAISARIAHVATLDF